jgi:predicted nucleotidyltransferase
MKPQELPLAEIAKVCRNYGVAELGLFGSALREDFRPDSDIDLLVMFQRGTRIGLMAYARLQRELSDLIGRPVDLVQQNALKSIVRDEVLRDVRSIYHAS